MQPSLGPLYLLGAYQLFELTLNGSALLGYLSYGGALSGSSAALLFHIIWRVLALFFIMQAFIKLREADTGAIHIGGAKIAAYTGVCLLCSLAIGFSLHKASIMGAHTTDLDPTLQAFNDSLTGGKQQYSEDDLKIAADSIMGNTPSSPTTSATEAPAVS